MHASRPLWQLDAAGAVICLAVISAWFWLGVAPLSDARDQRANLLMDLATKTEKEAKLRQSEARQKQRLAEFQLALKQSEVQLESVDSLNERLATLNELASASKLTVNEIKPGTPIALKHYTSVPVRIAGTGSYPAAAEFLHQLHVDKCDVGLFGFELRGEPEAPDKPPTFSFHLLWFAAPEGTGKAQPQKP